VRAEVNHNAASVVDAWRAGTGRDAWEPIAWNTPPSELVAATQQAFYDVSRAYDKAAKDLRNLGFKASHPVVKTLREQASDALAESSRCALWADKLRHAEQTT